MSANFEHKHQLISLDTINEIFKNYITGNGFFDNSSNSYEGLDISILVY